METDYLELDLRRLVDENQLAKIVAAEAAGLTLLAELVASLRKGTHQSRDTSVQSEAIAA